MTRTPLTRLILVLVGATWLVAAVPVSAQDAQVTTTRTLIERADDLRTVLNSSSFEGPDRRFVVERLEVGDGASYTIELEPSQVWTEDARVLVYEEEGVRERPAPRGRTFRGRATGVPGSRVVLRVRESGELRGILNADGRSWLIRDIGEATEQTTWERGSRRVSSPAIREGERGDTLHVREVDLDTPSDEGFTCDRAALGSSPPLLQAEPMRDLTTLQRKTARSLRGGPTHTARIAFATDHEYYAKFNDEEEAIEYIGDLIGFMSTIYEDDVQTSLLASYVEIYTTNNDPYTAAQGSCSLYQFGKHWNDNRTDVDRTLAHLLSGRVSNVGVAWLGVLCSGSFSLLAGSDTCGNGLDVGGDYGYTGGIDGNFNPANPQVLWDIAGVAHEIGHNFNSPHTHCYNGLGDNSDPIDECESGEFRGLTPCYAGAESLPGPQGAGSGTIMSYCNQRSGGLTNISLTFGTGHPYGVEPGRVPDRMRDHVLARASSQPACLAFTQLDEIFSDGFESGNITKWSP